MCYPRQALSLVVFIISIAAFAAPPVPSTIPALFLSDIHLDPFADPAKVVRLNASPSREWSSILAAPTSSTQQQDAAALQTVCPVGGTYTNYTLWQSSLKAIHANASHVRFATVSGDLLANSFECKYKTLIPAATHMEYIAFTEKTVLYIISTLRNALPGVPVYVAMGNNDSGCTDYHLDATHDQFLSHSASMVTAAIRANLPEAERNAVLTDFSTGGYYNVPLVSVSHTRLIVLDDIFFSATYATCSGKPDPAPAAAQLAWLEHQLTLAHEHHQHVWIMGHIPPGVNFYATARKLMNICVGSNPQMFLSSDALADVLARNSDIIRLGIFGHTHADEMRLLTSATPAIKPSMPHLDSEMWKSERKSPQGVPLKIVASITAVNGNHPTFTIARIDPSTATLIDYTVIEASNLSGIDTTWSPEYTYSTAYHQPAFDSTSVASLITGFHSDSAAKSRPSQIYLRSYYAGDISTGLQLPWPQYTCSMNHDSRASFAACACAVPANHLSPPTP